MKLRRRKWFIGGAALLLVVLILPIIVASVVLTPVRLSKILTEYSEKYIDGKVEFSDIRFNIFTYFPYTTISVDGGRVISYALNRECDSLVCCADTLLQFKQLNVAVNPLTLIGSTITIRYVGVKGLMFNGVTASDGRANWDIIMADTSKNEQSESIGVSLKELKITDGLVADYKDYKTSDQYHLSLNDMLFKGNLTDNKIKLKIDQFAINGVAVSGDNVVNGLKFSSLIDEIALEKSKDQDFTVDIKSVSNVMQDTIELCRELPVELVGGLKFDSLSRGRISFDNLALKVSDIDLMFNGGVMIGKDSTFSDMVCTINPLKIAGVIDLIPEELAPAVKNISTNIAIDFKTTVRGSYVGSTNRLPQIDLDLKIDNGFLVYDKTKARLDTVKCDIALSYSPENANILCDIRAMRLKGSGLDVDVKASVSDLLTDPLVKGKFLFDLDMKQLSESLDLQSGVTAAGSMSLDLDVEARQSWLNIKSIGRSTIIGRMVFNDFVCHSPKDSIDIIANGGINFGSIINKKDSLMGINSRIIGASALFDTLNIKHRGGDLLAVSNMKISVRSSSDILSGDSTKTAPMGGVITSELIKLPGVDSTMLLFRKTNGSFTILPSKEYAAAPNITTDFKSKIIYMRGNINRYVIYDAEVNLNSTLLTKNNMLASRRESMLDSLQKIYPTTSRDSLFAYLRSKRVVEPDDFKGEDIDMKVDESVADLFVKWGTTGWLKASRAHVITPYLPLKNDVENVDIRFTQNEVDIKNTNFIIGDSRLNLTAKISNIARALTRGAKLRVSSTLTADSIDFNQLNRAIVNGMKFTGRSAEFKDSLAMSSSNAMAEQMINETNDEQSDEKLLLIVPSNIDLTLHLDVDKCRYKTLFIECMKGEFISKDRCLQIKDLNAETNAGIIDLSVIYSTKSKNDLRTGFDLVMKDIEVAKLINLMPEIDSLLPMLRSFDGVVDCRMAATASLDTAMNIILPSLNAACAINGENMVLLDGETFTEIAKTLKFKNKKRNLIEKISVELLVRDNKIEVFPFLVTIDRYQTAISGVHNLDLTYQYHISVIRSPLPFRIGVNIMGDAEDFKYKLTRPKFKSANIPSYVNMIDTARVNLRETIINIFKDKKQKGISVEDMKIPLTIDTMSLVLPEEPLTKSDSLAIRQFEADSTSVVN